MIRVYRKLPGIIRTTLQSSEGWLVGSALSHLSENEIPKDYDIIIPNRENFQNSINMLSVLGGTHTINSFGGLKFTIDNIIIDIWCEELDHFLKYANKIQYIYNFKRNILLKKEGGV